MIRATHHLYLCTDPNMLCVCVGVGVLKKLSPSYLNDKVRLDIIKSGTTHLTSRICMYELGLI